MNDTRVFMGHRFEHDRGNWLFTGSSFPLQTALALNGFNERMDGMKSLEDCEFGIRLARYGCRFVMDQSVYCHILAHGNNDRKNPLIDGHDPNPPLKEELYTEIRSEISKENYGVLEWAQELGQIRANEGPITPEHLECIQRSTLKYRFFDPLAAENEERLARWLATPTFNLLQHRIELRSSSLWKW